ncbi:zinc finger protein 462-like isoform X2 [Corythoichthys intestinalis]|uniref:zinc finger protein 462-like isoform X2 n=1 Tax=Corythoichthys intestinalis TaxID=161448 RepID=UPI0025A534DC|nr:zinc finger protein 462-like isoform X2 [Corythoichthys intestinalis]
MVVSCWVRGCVNRADGTKKIGLYSIPKVRQHEGDFTKSLTEERRRLWLANIKRKDEPSKHVRVCSDHFITGRPANMYDRTNPDWAPTLKLEEMTPTESLKKHAELERKQNRFQRTAKRQEAKMRNDVASALLHLQDSCQHTPVDIVQPASPEGLADTDGAEASTSSIVQVTQVQVDSEVQRLLSENMTLRAELGSLLLTQDGFKGCTTAMTSYNGVQKEDADDAMHNQSAHQGQPSQSLQCGHCPLHFKSEVFLLEHLGHDHGSDPDLNNHAGKDSCQSTPAIPLADHQTDLLEVLNHLEDGKNLEDLTKKPERDVITMSANHCDEEKEKDNMMEVELFSTARETLDTSKDLKTYKKPQQAFVSKCSTVTDSQRENASDDKSDHKSDDDSDKLAHYQSTIDICSNRNFFNLKEDHLYHAALARPIFPASALEGKRTSNAEKMTLESTDKKDLSFEVSEDDEDKRVGSLTFTCKHCNYQDDSLKHMSAHYYKTHPYIRHNSAYIQDTNDQSATFRCLVCPVEFPNEDELRKHHGDKHSGFPDIFTLGRHQNNLAFKCFTCAFTTNALNMLKEHYKDMHPAEKLLNGLWFLKYVLTPCQEDASPVKSLGLDKTEPNVTLYQCNSCSFHHKSVIVLQVHYQKNHPEEAVTIDKIKRQAGVLLKKTPERPSSEVQTKTPDNIPILKIKSESPTPEKAKEGFQVQTKNQEQVKISEAKSESPIRERVRESPEAQTKTKDKVKIPKAKSELSVPQKVIKSTEVDTKIKEKVKISETTSKPRKLKNESPEELNKGFDSILEYMHKAEEHVQNPVERMTSSILNTIPDEELKPQHKSKTSNIYARPENLYFCFKCNYGNPTIKGMMVHQFRTHNKLRTTSEQIVEYTTAIHNKLQNATAHTENESFCPLLPLPILNEGDEHTFFCHFCHYRRSTVSKVVQHYIMRHSDAVATPKEIQAYTFRTLELLQKKDVCQTVQHKKTKNKQHAPEKFQSLQCKRCLYKTHNPNLFRIHIRKCHQGNNSSSGILKVSLKQGKAQSGYQCDLCSFSHKKSTTLYKHYLQEHPESRSSLDFITARLNEGHKNSLKKKRQDLTDGNESDTSGQSDTKIYSCRACSFKGSSVSGITDHYRAVHPWCVKEDGSVPGVGSRKKQSTSKSDNCFDDYQIPLESPRMSPERTKSAPTREKGNAASKKSRHCVDMGEETPVHVFKCPYCTYVNTKHQGVLTHCQMRHSTLQSQADSLYVDRAHLHDWEMKQRGQEGDGPSHFRGYMCEFCPQTHQTREKLRKHSEKAHGETAPDATAVTYAKKMHIKISKSVPYKIKMTLFRCQQCTYSCSNKIEFGRHMRLKHMSAAFQDCRYSCVLCSNSYYKKKRLGVHYKDKHGQNAYLKHFVPLYEQVPDTPPEPEDKSATKRLVYKCPLCPYVNSRKHGMATHCQMMHPDLTVRMEEFDREELVFRCNYQAGTNNKRGYQCHVCLGIYVSLKKLAIHRANRHGGSSKQKKETPASEELNAERTPSEAASVINAKPEGKLSKKTGVTRYCLFKCVLCSYSSVVRNRLAVHYTKRHGKTAFLKHFAPLYPPKIKKKVPLPQALISEQQENTPAGEQEIIYRCQLCEYKTWARRYLTYHYNKTHQLDAGTRDKLLIAYNKRKRTPSQNIPSESEQTLQGTGQTAPIGCKKCPDLTFDSLQLLLAHYCAVHRSNQRLDFTVIHPAGRTTGQYRCTRCCKLLNGISKLWRHLDRHREKSLTKIAAKIKKAMLPRLKTWKSSLEMTPNEHLDCTASREEGSPLKCGISVSPQKAGDHEQVDPESLIETHACGQCQRTFKSRNGLRTHKRSHEALAAIKKLPASLSQLNLNKYLLHKPGTIRPFQCSICFYRTNLMGLFTNHLLKNHLDIVIETCDKKEETEVTPSADTDAQLQVPIVSVAETNEGRTKDWYLEPPEVRRQLNHLSQMAQNGASASPASKQDHSGGPFQCESCSFLSQDLPTMRRHYLNRHSRKMLTCKDCHFFTGLKKAMKVHIDMDHSTVQKEAPSKDGLSCCPFCLYQTKNKNNMIDHVMLHREERVVPVEVRRPKLSRYLQGLVFRCHVCTYTSASADNLRSHAAKHARLNPYRCRLCYFDCTRLDQLEAHLCSMHQVMRNYELVGQVCLEQLEQMQLIQTPEDDVDEEEHISKPENKEDSFTHESETDVEKSQTDLQLMPRNCEEKPNGEPLVYRDEESGVVFSEISGKVAEKKYKRKLSEGFEEDGKRREKLIKMEEMGTKSRLKGDDKVLSCDLCGRNFQSGAELQCHASRHGM